MIILHLEDDPHDAELVRRLITAEWPAARITGVASRDAYVAALEREAFAVVLSDVAVPSFDGFEALRLAKERAVDTPFIFVSGTIGEERALEAMRCGADDYVLKDRIIRLPTAISRALRDSLARKERRDAEARIRELADSLNQAREAVIVTALDRRVTFWNHGAEKLSGWPSSDAVNRRSEELFDPATSARIAAACKTASDLGGWSGELDLRRRDGAVRTVELRISVIRDESGQPKSRLVLGTDITERRLAERRIREQADLLNQANEAIFITDLNHRVIYWNAGAERMLGWTAAEALGKTAEQLVEPPLHATVAAARDAVIRQGHWVGELRLNTRQQEPIIVESRQTLIRDEIGHPRARLCINADITERKRLEEQFLRAQRMENLGLLAAGIAHDLNNMLAPILLAAPMLRDHVNDVSAAKMLDTLEASAERGSMLVRQILAFAHGVGGENQLLQVKHLVRDIVAVISGSFPKSILVEDYVPSDLWAIKGNATQIHQVLLNLCVNARDAMPEGGKLRLVAHNRVLDDAAAAELDGARPGAFLMIEVEDTGSGIPPEIIKHIWQPFFTTKEAGRGTGLGLSTVRGIIETHRGFIDVRSTVGVGSCFRVFLPAAEEALPAHVTARQHVPLGEGSGELILVVDDEKEIRTITSTILARKGYRVLLAGDGAEAAVVFAQHAAEIRLVISDLHMPNLDGAMLVRALRRINPAVKMLVMSGMATALAKPDELRVEEFADALLLKPFKVDTLLRKVQELLGTAKPPVGPG